MKFLIIATCAALAVQIYPAAAQAPLLPGNYSSPPPPNVLDVQTNDQGNTVHWYFRATSPSCGGFWGIHEYYQVPNNYRGGDVSPSSSTCDGTVNCGGINIECGGVNVVVRDFKQTARDQISFFAFNNTITFDRNSFFGAAQSTASNSRTFVADYRLTKARGPDGSLRYAIIKRIRLKLN